MKDKNPINNGMKVRTVSHLGSTPIAYVPQYRLDLRRPNALGTVRGWVGGHGGDVWWVMHEDLSVAPYMFSEFELEPKPISRQVFALRLNCHEKKTETEIAATFERINALISSLLECECWFSSIEEKASVHDCNPEERPV